MKKVFNWWAVPEILLESLFLIVVATSLSEFGVQNFIVKGEGLLILMLNLSLFYMLIIFYLNRVLKVIQQDYLFKVAKGDK